MPGNILLVLFFTKSFLPFKPPYFKDKDMGGDLKQLKIMQDSTAFSVGHLLMLLLPYSHMPTVTFAFSLITLKKKMYVQQQAVFSLPVTFTAATVMSPNIWLYWVWLGC